MTTTPQTESSSESDASLWKLVRQGSEPAFEVLVRRYQSLICSVAYSTCGNLALSEEVAQETLWTAWRQRIALDQPDRLRFWLCGIARNLAKNARRTAARQVKNTEPLDDAAQFSASQHGPVEEAVSREQETMIWQALERIPEAYRMPLILFYREDQSVADVAAALNLSENAVKKRLSRGRWMLREEIAGQVEVALKRTRPGARFTGIVVAGLAANAAAKPALAGAGAGAGLAAWKAAVAPGAAVGLGGAAGILAGLLGGWLGTWIPAQLAPTLRERETILHAGRRMLIGSVIFMAFLFGLIHAFAGKPGYLLAWGGWMVAFWGYVIAECVRLARAVRRIREQYGCSEPLNETAVRSAWATVAKRVGSHVYRSQATLLGLPLVDINLSAPAPAGDDLPESSALGRRRLARGWIAIGDDARGIVLAMGSRACGLIALGGRACGVLSVGGLALGLVAFGGLGLGVLGVGGLGAGVYALGGGAVGWRAAGGVAVGWNVACGGAALARHAALGGVALAGDHAVGGQAHARHANDEAARAFFRDDGFTRFCLTLMGQRQALSLLSAAPQVADAPGGKAGAFSLDNGLAVQVRPIQGTSDVALLVLYQVGGDHDPVGKSGLAHLVEHLYVTAATGASPARTAQAFFHRYRSGCNAQTGDRYTVVATVFPRQDLEQELADAAARMADLRITATDLNREKPRLLDEVSNMFGRIPALGAMNVARELIRPAPRGGRKGGLPEHVQAITLDDVRTYWTRYYKPRNAILVLAGAVDEAAARHAVAAHFAGIEPGESAPEPAQPGMPRPGTVRELAARSLQPQAPPVACLAYAAPEPESALYPPFLVLVSRFYAATAPAGGSGTDRPSVYFPLLEDPAVIGVSASARPGEKAAEAIARLESFVAGTIATDLGKEETVSVRQTFAFFLGTAELPDLALAQNPYGVALSLARRQQLKIDPLRLSRGLDALTSDDLRRAAREIFAASRHAAAFIVPER